MYVYSVIAPHICHSHNKHIYSFQTLMSASRNYISVIAMQTVRTLKEDITALAEKGL